MTFKISGRPPRSPMPRLGILVAVFSVVMLSVAGVGATTSISLAANQCMPVRTTDTSAVPFLPIYQPFIGASDVDKVVISPPTQPAYNQFTVRDAWDDHDPPIVPITSWSLGQFTGLMVDASLASYQRGHIDQYGYSGIQVAGNDVGLWLNSMDPTVRLYPDSPVHEGSNALNIGCWYSGNQRPNVFPSLAHELDISFMAGVKYDGSIAPAAAQAYFEFVAVDQSGGCRIGGQECGLTFQVGYYGRDPSLSNLQNAHGDLTLTTPDPIAQAAIESPTWLHRIPGDGSLNFQSAEFKPGLMHFRVSPPEFIEAIKAVRGLANNSGEHPYAGLSMNPLDYGFSLVGADGEIYTPVGVHGQLGMTVSSLRVTTTIPHRVSGGVSGFNQPVPSVLYRDGADIKMFKSRLDGSPNELVTLSMGAAAGDPVGYYAGNAARVLYRDSARHLREIFENQGGWSEWDMTNTLGLPSVGSDPRVYTDTDGGAQVIFRDIVGDVHLTSMEATGWHDLNISAISLPRASPAIGSPMLYTANGTRRIVYRDEGNHIVELYYFNGVWNQWRMTDMPGSVLASSDPVAYVDSNQQSHVVYKDDAGAIHEFLLGAEGWTQTNLTGVTEATLAQGSPMGVFAGSAPRVVYRGVDNRLHELVWWSGAWSQNDLSQSRGAVALAGDPYEFTGSDGVVRIEYVGMDDQIHELFYGNGWIHRDM